MKGVTACVYVFYVCVWKNEQNLLWGFFLLSAFSWHYWLICQTDKYRDHSPQQVWAVSKSPFDLTKANK